MAIKGQKLKTFSQELKMKAIKMKLEELMERRLLKNLGLRIKSVLIKKNEFIVF